LIKERYLIGPALNDLAEKMVFIGGPVPAGFEMIAYGLSSQNALQFASESIDGNSSSQKS